MPTNTECHLSRIGVFRRVEELLGMKSSIAKLTAAVDNAKAELKLREESITLIEKELSDHIKATGGRPVMVLIKPDLAAWLENQSTSAIFGGTVFKISFTKPIDVGNI